MELENDALGEAIKPLSVPQEFIHPFKNQPLAWRIVFIVKRIFTLAITFTPLAICTILEPILSRYPSFRGWYLQLMVKSFERAGCSFQKIGQWLSMRPDLLSPDVIEALSALRDDGPKHSFEHSRHEIEAAFGARLEDVFEYVDPVPIASGSIAQVHKAKLRSEYMQSHGMEDLGFQEVAIKVRHPEVLESTWVDADIIFNFFGIAGKVFANYDMAMPFDKKGFYSSMVRQLDLNWEAYNLRQFQENFQGEHRIVFPLVAHSTESVLVESWINGQSVAKLFEAVDGQDFSVTPKGAHRTAGEMMEEKRKKKLAQDIFDMTIKMYLRDNYIHGDLHGGNLMYSTDPHDDRIYVLDAGLTTALEKDWASPFGYLLHALTTGDADKAADKLLMFNKSTAPLDVHAFKSELKDVMNLYMPSSSRHHVAGHEEHKQETKGPINLGAMIGHILSTLYKHNINLRGDVAITIVTMSISEGLIRQLDPEFDVVRSALPYFVRFRSWQRPSLTGKDWSKEVEGANGGLPLTGTRGVAVTSSLAPRMGA